jgi:hypothetical protein
MRNRLGSREYGVGLPQNGPSGQDSRARLAGKARHAESGLALRACHARYVHRARERLAEFFNIREGKGSTSCSRCFREKWERNSREIDKKMRLSYGRIFLVTFSKPVQRKSTEDNPVATPDFEAA